MEHTTIQTRFDALPYVRQPLSLAFLSPKLVEGEGPSMLRLNQSLR